MAKTRLPTLERAAEGLGRPNILDPGLVARYGAPYVRWAALAVDLDRWREVIDAHGMTEAYPFGWEVFLTEMYLLDHFRPDDAHHHAMVEDACLAAMELEPDVLGTGLPFAVSDAVERGAWSDPAGALFSTWKGRGKTFSRKLQPLWEAPHENAQRLSQALLLVPIAPPPAPPTAQYLERLAHPP